ncbi:MAG: carboxypeptidase regulatory-like domain-containing protein [Acidobacteria bacterium]|nr:carboxypeptidase regulatory-like domain-containing protein [Acidobacteriota bacterium]
MSRQTTQHTWTARLLLAACFLAPMASVVAGEPKPAVPNSEIRGKVLGTDGRPAAGVEILAYHLATEEVFTTTTDGKGRFTLADLPYGYFDLAVRSSAGLYVSDQVANVSPTGQNVIAFRLLPFYSSTRADQRAFPGADEIPVGLASVIDQRMVGDSFWRSAKGISIVAGGAAVVLLALAGGSGSTASPTLP